MYYCLGFIVFRSSLKYKFVLFILSTSFKLFLHKFSTNLKRFITILKVYLKIFVYSSFLTASRIAFSTLFSISMNLKRDFPFTFSIILQHFQNTISLAAFNHDTFMCTAIHSTTLHRTTLHNTTLCSTIQHFTAIDLSSNLHRQLKMFFIFSGCFILLVKAFSLTGFKGIFTASA